MKIQFKQVSKQYSGRPVIAHLNWTVCERESWRVTGASGIGKTTLLRLLMGLEQPDSGCIIGRQDVRVTACFQEHRLCDWLTPAQNIRLVCGRDISDAQISDALAAVLPPTCFAQKAGTLSGGMQRRAALVRALLPPGDLVLLDEPFAGLDADSITRAMALIERYRRGRALVLVSHEGYTLPGHNRTLMLG